MQAIRKFLFNPVSFFSERLSEERFRLLPLLFFLLLPMSDFVANLVVFNKIGAHNFSQRDVAAIASGYFGAVISQEITLGLKAGLFLLSWYLIIRILKR